MKVPVRLSVHGTVLSGQIRGLIEQQLEKLEERSGRITSCHVTLRAPGAHHRMGEPVAVHIRLALPGGRQVVVGPPSPKDPRCAEMAFAIHEAFRNALRQLTQHTDGLRARR